MAPPRCCCGRRSGMGLLVKPAGTDESGGTATASFVCRDPGDLDPLGGQLGERLVELDPQPVPSELLGHDPDSPGTEERIQHQAGLPPLLAPTDWSQLTPNSEPADVPSRIPLPRSATRPADP